MSEEPAELSPYLTRAGLLSAVEPATVPGGSARRAFVVDEYHRRTFGEHMFSGGAAVVDSLTDLDALDVEWGGVTVVDTRPESWIAAAERFLGGEEIEDLTIISTQHCLVVLETLAEVDLPAMSVDRVATRRGRFVTGFRRPIAGDVGVGPLLTGLRTGVEPLIRSQRDLLHADAARGSAPRPADAERAELNARIATLSGQLAALEANHHARGAELANLRTRYRNLSRSLLGRTTIKYWNLRRRLRR
ncbi:hypothetical protein GCM10028820_07450 [Tessaracoccus terricola]